VDDLDEDRFTESPDLPRTATPELTTREGAIPFLTRGQSALFAALVVVVLLVGNASTSLWDQDEAAYAGFARTMLRSGDWVVPHFTWSEVHRKTPLLFWCIAASFALFGENEFALRLPTVLAIFLTVVAVAAIGRPIFGKRVAYLAAALLATMNFVSTLGKVALTDSLVLLFETLAALALIRVLERDTAGRIWRWTLLFWASVALGTLAKGPVILVFAGGLAAWLTLFHPRRRELLLGLQPWFFLPLALLPIFCWGWLAWQRTDGKLITWMIDWYVKNRATKAVFGQTGPPGYYLISFLVTMLPWSFLLPAALVRVWQRRKEPVYCVLTAWLFSGWLIWEFAASKLPSYAIGAYPAFALLFAYELLDPKLAALWNRRSVRFGVRLAVALSIAIAIGLLAVAIFFLKSPRVTLAAAVPAALLFTIPAWAMARMRAGDILGAVRIHMFGAIAGIVSIWGLLITQLEPMRSMPWQITQIVEAESPAGAKVLLGEGFGSPSLPFYLGKKRDSCEIDAKGLDLALRRLDSVATILVLNDDVYLTIQEAARTHGWRPIRLSGFDIVWGRDSTCWVLVAE
jgi:4-amino-4-deoxy-L-arabinose transferase-like glycosyltransferase